MTRKENKLIEKIWGLTQKNSKVLTKMGKHVAVLNQEMGDVKTDIKDIKKVHSTELDDMKDDYVTKLEFTPVRKIVYGTVGAILMAVLTALLALVVRK